MKSINQNAFDLKKLGVEEIDNFNQQEINGGLSISLPSLPSLPSGETSFNLGLSLVGVLGGLSLGLGLSLGFSAEL